MTTELRKFANLYADQGFALVPIPPGKKMPSGEEWMGWNTEGKYLMNGSIAEFWSRNPNHNIGVVLAPSRVVSLDIDDVEHARLVMSEFGIDIDALRESNAHIIGNPERFRVVFRAPEGVELSVHKLNWPRQDDPKKSKGVLEFRAGMNQDVYPPSLHPDGHIYRWGMTPKQAGGLKPLPDDILKLWLNWSVFAENAKRLCPWLPEDTRRPTARAPSAPSGNGNTSIAAFNAAHGITEMLERYGYKRRGKRYLSPHSETGIAGVLIHDDNKACIMHGSDPLCYEATGQLVGPFDLFMHYEHGGDFKSAIQAAEAELGIARQVRVRHQKKTPVAADLPDHDPETGEITEAPTAPGSLEQCFTVLGYDHGRYYVFVHGSHQLRVLNKADLCSTAALLELAPSFVWEAEFPQSKKNKDGEISTSMNKVAIAEYLIHSAHAAGVYDPSRVRGRGANIDAGRFVMHFGDFLSVDGERMPVSSIKSRYVYEMAIPLSRPAAAMADRSDGDRIMEIARRFRWSRPGSALLLAGWTFLAPICGALKWRPHIWLTGGAGCGKSTILSDFVHPLMNDMAVFAQGASSEAGIRQTLRCDARPVLFDESEQNSERETVRMQGVLALIRQASSESAAQTLKGTAGGDAMQFHIRSMFCLSSIQVGIQQKADIDRLTVLALRPLHRGAKNSQTEAEWNWLKEEMYWVSTSGVAARVVARTLALWSETKEAIDVCIRVAARRFGSQRVGDQYGTLIAGAWMLVCDRAPTDSEALALIDEYDWDEHQESAESSESDRCYSALLEARVRTEGGSEYTVAELCMSAEEFAERALLRYGIKVKDGLLCIANASESFPRLFRHTPFEADPRALLRRLEGAEKGEGLMSFLGKKSRWIGVPLPENDK